MKDVKARMEKPTARWLELVSTLKEERVLKTTSRWRTGDALLLDWLNHRRDSGSSNLTLTPAPQPGSCPLVAEKPAPEFRMNPPSTGSRVSWRACALSTNTEESCLYSASAAPTAGEEERLLFSACRTCGKKVESADGL